MHFVKYRCPYNLHVSHKLYDLPLLEQWNLATCFKCYQSQHSSPICILAKFSPSSQTLETALRSSKIGDPDSHNMGTCTSGEGAPCRFRGHRGERQSLQHKHAPCLDKSLRVAICSSSEVAISTNRLSSGIHLSAGRRQVTACVTGCD